MSGIREQLSNLLCAVSISGNFVAASLIKIMFDESKPETAGIIFAGTVLYDALFIAGCCYASGLCSQDNPKVTVRIDKDLEEQAIDTAPLLQQQPTSYGALKR
ncbi:MAG: hypothetical protein P1U34_12100 [Coxiellaceae bacterium]|nr:hypothetical protein [Coxiellaceae bacterium]